MATITGTDGNDTREGTRLADDMAGLAGNDTLLGWLGDDQIDGGDGNDRLEGGPDNDVIFGGPGNDDLYDGTHDDTLYGGQGDDRLRATDGYDVLDGGAGIDHMTGEAGYVTMQGGPGDDLMVAGRGGSNMTGGPGNDIMEGGIGSDSFNSETTDADTFVIRARDGNFGFDNISGFNGAGETGGDRISLVGFDPANVTVTERYGFLGSVYFSTEQTALTDTSTGEVQTTEPVTSTNAPEDAIAATTDETVAKLTSTFGSPTERYTEIKTDQGTLTIDAVGLDLGSDYMFV